MIVRFIILILVTWAIVHKLYYKKSHRRDFYFSFMLMSVAIFFLVYFMIFELEDLKTKTSIGIGIGLFGIFSIMRYRTDAMPVREDRILLHHRPVCNKLVQYDRIDIFTPKDDDDTRNTHILGVSYKIKF